MTTTVQQAEPLSPELQQAKQMAEAQIDAYLKNVGIADPSQLIDEDGWRHFQMGSAPGFAYIDESDGELYLNTAAVVMHLPSDKDLILPLMRDVLELNMLIWGSAKLSISQETILVAAIERVDDLQQDGVARCIHRVMSLADDLDDDLIEKYGGTSIQRGS
ncbi:T3SS (YopN, CesT) and YbjN peptide-binding chaperone 1 [Pantanalinema rosaneae CENA516]|uniref:T3SS (YopN, CesT) and YbjN peptide-binding chaperone 1 n=1 Tax=Pantanalinema rosaneae TaxID=1620701 RepID=UPI003D6FB1BF